jgi:hypothetical protein
MFRNCIVLNADTPTDGLATKATVKATSGYEVNSLADASKSTSQNAASTKPLTTSAIPNHEPSFRRDTSLAQARLENSPAAALTSGANAVDPPNTKVSFMRAPSHTMVKKQWRLTVYGPFARSLK